jgi:adenylate cyclase
MGNPIMKFWKELQQRKVIRVAVAYLVIGWVVVEVSSVLLPSLLLPDWTGRLVVALVALGFPVALVLAWVFDVSPEGLRRERPRTDSAERAPDAQTGGVSPATVPEAKAAESRRSILVLPFANLSDDDQRFFSDGVTEEILTLLARVPDLHVVSRTTSFSFRESGLDLRAIASKLGVELVLEGSVRRADKRVRITAQLIDPATDTHIWSDRYDRELTDIFGLQGEIARCIVDALQLDPDCCPTGVAATGEIEAYDFYLRGRQYFHTLTKSSLGFARQMFQQAIAIDPDFALAYAGLADTESIASQWIDASPERLEAADRASRRALELAPDLAETHAARGHALSINGDYSGAAQEFERALELEPNNYNVLYLYGRTLFAEGNTESAADFWQRAHAAQPDEFQAISLRTVALRALGWESEHREAVREAVRVVRQRLELNPDDQRALALGAGVMVDFGEPEEGLAMMDRLVELAPDDNTTLYNGACVYAQAGRNDKALELLERRVHLGKLYRDWVEHDPDFAGLRDDSRFQALLERMV